MQAVLVLAALLLVEVYSQVCNSTTFWNPLNNACVNRKIADTQSAPGSLPSFTTPIRRRGSAWSPVPPPPPSTPMISYKPASIVSIETCSLPLERHPSNLLR